MAYLRVGRMEIDWSQNSIDHNHGKLFLPSDKTIGTYYYAGSSDEKDVYSRKLIDCKGRLELLGYDLESCRKIYDDLKERHYSGDYYEEIHGITFDQFSLAMSQVDLSKLNPDFDDYGDFEYGEFVARVAFQMDEFNKIVPLKNISYYKGGEFFTNLGPMLVLRLLLENKENQNQNLVWCYKDIIENEYISENDVPVVLEAKEKFLIVTEGSTDSIIIKKAFEMLRPDIADFFTFIDMGDNYPFTGTGNLLNFAKGLKSISVQNKVIIIFDNDAEGVGKFNIARELNLPANMRVTKLPNLNELTNFRTLGPSGEAREDVNGKAGSIEMFLDFKFIEPEPVVRWKNFVPETGTYHGVIEKKEEYLRSFKPKNTNSGEYNFSKLNILIQHIYSEALKSNPNQKF